MSRPLSGAVLAELAAAGHRACYRVDLQIGAQLLQYTDWPEVVGSYTPRALDFDALEQSQDAGASEVTLRLDNVDLALTDNLLAANNEVPLALSLDLAFLDSTGAVIDAVPLVANWRATVELVDQDTATLRAVAPLAELDESLPRRVLGPTCPWRFGDAATCAATLGSIKGTVAGQTVDLGSTATIILDAARTEDVGYLGPGTYWADGYLTVTSGPLAGTTQRVKSSAAGSLTLEFPLPSAPAAGATYTLERGCNRSFDTCERRFANTAQFGGFANVPRRQG